MSSERRALQIQPVNARNDDELMASLLAGDESALVALYERHVRPVYVLVVRVLHDDDAAEEVVQDAFMRVWRRAAEYDPGRSTFRSWVLTIAHHLSVDALRRRRSRLIPMMRRLDDESSTPVEPRTSDLRTDPVKMAEEAETRATVRDALAALPGVQRAAIELAYFGGLSQSEIADATGIPLGTIKSRIRFGMQALHAELEQRGHGAGERSG